MLSIPRIPRSVLFGAVVAAFLLGGFLFRSQWLPAVKTRVLAWASDGGSEAGGGSEHGHAHDEHEGHHHDGDASSIAVSAQGLKNIGFRPLQVTLSPYTQTTRLPAMIVERPGRTQIQVAAPMSGIVTRVLAQEGTAVETGSVLFEMRLFHEELVTAQREFLKTAESLDVVNRELARLKSLSEGLVPGKRLLDEEYERQKLEASLKADKQGLILHGLTEAQVDDILKTRKLLQNLVVRAPQHARDEGRAAAGEAKPSELFHVQKLDVQPGQQVEAGSPMCILADHAELFVEGRAFEDNVEQLKQALEERWPVRAHLAGNSGGDTATTHPLQLLYLADHVDPDSRAFRFYLTLPNALAADRVGPDGRRYIAWRFRPGQRLELEIPVSTWKERIVLPLTAVVDEGAENYVFRQNGSKFERVAVHVEHRDRSAVVIANDGSLFPGEIIAERGAYQLQLAIKNQSGGGVDPHAGHTH